MREAAYEKLWALLASSDGGGKAYWGDGDRYGGWQEKGLEPAYGDWRGGGVVADEGMGETRMMELVDGD